ncbi:hypothetical protein Tco_1171041 [Tanacetum coccineum]
MSASLSPRLMFKSSYSSFVTSSSSSSSIFSSSSDLSFSRVCSSLMVLVLLITWSGEHAHRSGTCTYVAEISSSHVMMSLGLSLGSSLWKLAAKAIWKLRLKYSAWTLLILKVLEWVSEAVCSHLDGLELGRYYGVFLWL